MGKRKKKSTCEFWHPSERLNYKTPSGCKHGDWCIYIHAGTAGDDNGKNPGAIAVRIPDTEAVNFVLRASGSEIYWRSTIKIEKDWESINQMTTRKSKWSREENDAKTRKERACMGGIHTREKNEKPKRSNARRY